MCSVVPNLTPLYLVNSQIGQPTTGWSFHKFSVLFAIFVSRFIVPNSFNKVIYLFIYLFLFKKETFLFFYPRQYHRCYETKSLAFLSTRYTSHFLPTKQKLETG